MPQSEHVDTFKVGPLTVHVDIDEYPEDPREWDNLGTMVCLHKRYSLGDEHEYRAEDQASWNELKNTILQDNPDAVILPLYLFDHSGLTMSTGSAMFRECDRAGWDWGQVGLIFVSGDDIRKEYGECSDKTRELVTTVLDGEVETYDQYLRGLVYEWTVEGDDEEVLDSCGGYFDEKHCADDARAAAECAWRRLPRAIMVV